MVRINPYLLLTRGWISSLAGQMGSPLLLKFSDPSAILSHCQQAWKSMSFFCNNSLAICELTNANSRDGTGLWVEKLSEAFDWDLLPATHRGITVGERSQRESGGRQVIKRRSCACTEEAWHLSPPYPPPDNIFRASQACKGQRFPLAGRREMSMWGWVCACRRVWV